MVGFPACRQEPTVGVKFISAGTAACIADIITFPLDVAKVRLQVSSCFADILFICRYPVVYIVLYEILNCKLMGFSYFLVYKLNFGTLKICLKFRD